MCFPTPVRPHRFIYLLIAGAGRSIKHLPALSAVICGSYWMDLSLREMEPRVMFLRSDFHFKEIIQEALARLLFL